MVVKILMHDVKGLDVDAVIVGFHEDVRPLKGAAGALDWLLCGALSRLNIQNKVRGAVGEVALLTSQGKIPAAEIFMVGLGQRGASQLAPLRTAAQAAATSAVNAGVARAALDWFQEVGSSRNLKGYFRQGGGSQHLCRPDHER